MSRSSYEPRSGSHEAVEDSSELESNDRNGTTDEMHVKSAAAHGRECAAPKTIPASIITRERRGSRREEHTPWAAAAAVPFFWLSSSATLPSGTSFLIGLHISFVFES